MNTKPVVTNLIQVYASASGNSDEDIESFYNDLQTIKDKIPKREITIIIGDYNAKIGGTIDNESGIGEFGLGERNERGDLLANFCQSNDMVIINILFKHPLRRRYTWVSPGDLFRNQIDWTTFQQN